MAFFTLSSPSCPALHYSFDALFAVWLFCSCFVLPHKQLSSAVVVVACFALQSHSPFRRPPLSMFVPELHRICQDWCLEHTLVFVVSMAMPPVTPFLFNWGQRDCCPHHTSI